MSPEEAIELIKITLNDHKPCIEHILAALINHPELLSRTSPCTLSKSKIPYNNYYEYFENNGALEAAQKVLELAPTPSSFAGLTGYLLMPDLPSSSPNTPEAFTTKTYNSLSGETSCLFDHSDTV